MNKLKLISCPSRKNVFLPGEGKVYNKHVQVYWRRKQKEMNCPKRNFLPKFLFLTTNKQETKSGILEKCVLNFINFIGSKY